MRKQTLRRRVVYIGRGTPWGNPYRFRQVCTRCGKIHDQKGSTIPCFREYAKERLAKEPAWLDPLVGEHLYCSGCKKGALSSNNYDREVEPDLDSYDRPHS